MHDDLGRADDVHIHLHAHLEKEELRVALQAVDLEYVRVVGVIDAHPQVRLHAGGELAQYDSVLRDTHDRDDALAFETVLVDLGILGVFDLFVADILIVSVPSVPADDEDQRRLLADLLRAFLPHGVHRLLNACPVREFCRSGDYALAAGDSLGVGCRYIVDDPLDEAIEVFFLVGTDRCAVGRSSDAGLARTAFCGRPDGVADVLVLLLDQQAQHCGLDLRIELAEHQITIRLGKFPVFLVVTRIEFQVNHEVLRHQRTLGQRILVLAVLAFGSVIGCRCWDIVLNDVPDFNGRERVLMLDAALDVYQPLFEGVVPLGGIG